MWTLDWKTSGAVDHFIDALRPKPWQRSDGELWAWTFLPLREDPDDARRGVDAMARSLGDQAIALLAEALRDAGHVERASALLSAGRWGLERELNSLRLRRDLGALSGMASAAFWITDAREKKFRGAGPDCNDPRGEAQRAGEVFAAHPNVPLAYKMAAKAIATARALENRK